MGQDALHQLAEGRPSVAIVANGGSITLAEVDANVRAGRRMILVEHSGRAADAVIALLNKTTPGDPDVERLRAEAQTGSLDRQPELFDIVPVSAGPDGLAAAIERIIGGR